MLGRVFSSLWAGSPARAVAREPLQEQQAAPQASQAPQAPQAPPATPREVEDARLRDDDHFRRRQLELAGHHAYFAGMQWIESLLARPALADPKRLERYGGTTYSQNDEDGIIAEIFRRIGAPHRSFVEFGCGNGLENNTLCLLAQGWRGLWMDGGDENAKRIAAAYQPLISAGVLQFKHAFIDGANIDGLIAAANLGAEIDLLSIDLDGNDLYLWDAIRCVSARVVVAEYNGKFLPHHEWSIIYDPGFMWDGSDLCGCSLASLARLAGKKGYQLVGCNITGGNAFFVRADLAADLFATPATPEHLFQPARYMLSACFNVGHPTSTLSVLQGACTAAGLPWPPVEAVAEMRDISLL